MKLQLQLQLLLYFNSTEIYSPIFYWVVHDGLGARPTALWYDKWLSTCRSLGSGMTSRCHCRADTTRQSYRPVAHDL